MEAISNTEIDTSLIRVPSHLKRVLRRGELGTYDVLELMGNAINTNVDEVCELEESLSNLITVVDTLKNKVKILEDKVSALENA